MPSLIAALKHIHEGGDAKPKEEEEPYPDPDPDLVHVFPFRSRNADLYGPLHPYGPFQQIPNDVARGPWRRRAVAPAYEEFKTVRMYGSEKEERGAVVYAEITADTSAAPLDQGTFELAMAKALRLKPGMVAIANVGASVEVEISTWDPRSTQDAVAELAGSEVGGWPISRAVVNRWVPYAVFLGEPKDDSHPLTVNESWGDFDRTARAVLSLSVTTATHGELEDFDPVIFAGAVQRCLGKLCQKAGCGKVVFGDGGLQVNVWAESCARPKQITAKLLALPGTMVCGYMVEAAERLKGRHAAY